MSEVSQLIQPLISTAAMSTLTPVVPGVGERDEVSADGVLNSRSMGISRYRQVLLTSGPLLFADLLALVACYLVATLATFAFFGTRYYPGLWNNVLALGLCHAMVGRFLGLFPASGINPVCELRNQLTSIGASFVLLVTLNGLVGQVTRNELLAIGIAFPLTILVAPASRFCTRRICAPFSWWGEKVVVVGSGAQGRHVYEFLYRQPQRGLKPIGMVSDNPNEYWLTDEGESFDFLGTTSELVQICRTHDCHWVIAAVAEKSDSEVRHILTQGSLIPNLVVLNHSVMMPAMWTSSFDAAGLSGLHIRDRLLFPFQRLMKRFADVTVSASLLILSIPLVAIIGIWIKMKSPGPIFFCHYGRVGRSGKTFGAWKVRSMVQNAAQVLDQHLASNPEAMAEWKRDQKLRNDPRIIPGIGQLLRKTSLDELPQLWNVLTGDMSLVGPRPIVGVEIARYGETFQMYSRVRPGLTGLWQVSGRNNTSYDDRVHLDNYYVRNWSMWLDYFILLRTVRTVLLREGSY